MLSSASIAKLSSHAAIFASNSIVIGRRQVRGKPAKNPVVPHSARSPQDRGHRKPCHAAPDDEDAADNQRAGATLYFALGHGHLMRLARRRAELRVQTDRGRFAIAVLSDR